MKIISNEDKKRLIKAITLAENNTSGEIRVHFQKKVKGDIYEAAVKKFEKLGMTKTELRNGVLIYVALKNREFAIVGDTGIHEKVDSGFWDETVKAMKEHFSQDDIILGIEKGLEIAGKILKQHFPHELNDKNELSDEISIN
ncbi:MAG TPA: TPM domain-containing protein [Victivallales bacterium]|nr:TPM domain-containing protein [Victivallales bacterium]